MPLLDTDQLTAISAGVPELLLPILEDFQGTTREALENLRQTLTAGRMQDASSEFHQLKGASGTLGLREFHDRCARYEAEATTALSSDAPDELLILLESSVAAARDFLVQAPGPGA